MFIYKTLTTLTIILSYSLPLNMLNKQRNKPVCPTIIRKYVKLENKNRLPWNNTNRKIMELLATLLLKDWTKNTTTHVIFPRVKY
jgi:hypothetical protein